jgi:hypothetical protein
MRKAPILLLVVGLSVALPLFAEPEQESLGNLARQFREQREKEGKKPVKVFTNDNLPSPPAWEKAPTAVPGPPEAPAGEKANPVQPAANPPESAEQKTSVGPESPEDKVKTRDYWQAKFSQARAKLARAREQEQLVEDELNLLQIQQARELDPNTRQELEAKVRDKQAEVDTKRAATDAAQKALTDLENEFKESGAPEDWSNPG